MNILYKKLKIKILNVVLYTTDFKPYKIELAGWLWGVYNDCDSLLL